MAGRDYYQQPSRNYEFDQSLRPPGLGLSQPVSNTSSRNDLDSIYAKYSSPSPKFGEALSPAPSYHSEQPQRNQPFYPESDNGSGRVDDLYADDIPLKPKKKTRLQTGQQPWEGGKDPRYPSSQQPWQGQDTRYPPSPESDRPTGLIPHPTPMGKKGWLRGKIPWVVYFVSTVQFAVFIAEIVKNSIITGSPIMIHPQFNPMIGPSTYVMINMGARFVPCMRPLNDSQTGGITIPQFDWPCPNTTSSDPTDPRNHCDLSALCGFGGLNDAKPDQWFRFIIPMFLHAGIVHIGFNLLLQLTMGREMELAIGSIRFALVYFSSGIFGFVLGGNFAATAIASTGASGCLFGILALTLLDLIYCWQERPSPVKDLMWILCDVLVSFVLGLLPGLDNFSHIGGFLMGLVLGICILHSPNPLRRRIGEAPVPYSPMPNDPKRPTTATVDPLQVFAKEPVGFFKGRKPLWWAWWLLRCAALVGVLVAFFVLLSNFYKYRDTCSWCKYLSCLPINHWCELGNLQLSNGTSKARRDVLLTGTGLARGLWDGS